MKELIRYMAQALVDNSDQVDVQEINTLQTLVLELRVAKEDLGKVIGKKGRTAQAMRIILSCAAAKEQKKKHPGNCGVTTSVNAAVGILMVTRANFSL